MAHTIEVCNFKYGFEKRIEDNRIQCSNKSITATITDIDFFFSPSNGFVTLQKEVVSVRKPFLKIKGESLTLQKLFQNPYLDDIGPFLVMDVLSTKFNISKLKAPYSGFNYNEIIDPIEIYNYPFKFQKLNSSIYEFEKELLINKNIDYDLADYLFYNRRGVTKIYAAKIGVPIYIVTIVDNDITDLAYYYKDQEIIHQNMDLGEIKKSRFHNFIIIPKRDWYNIRFKSLLKMYVSAGIDTIVEFYDK